jgi:6-pyruvoyltetrahydropterin/6-carboxytetrahydropterin synthase
MRSFTTLDLQYAHRFYGFKGEAQYLHGHTGILTIEVEDDVNMGVNMVFPCNEIKKIAWEVLQNFDHALILREDDPLLPAIFDVYEAQGIKNGTPTAPKSSYCTLVFKSMYTPPIHPFSVHVYLGKLAALG